MDLEFSGELRTRSKWSRPCFPSFLFFCLPPAFIFRMSRTVYGFFYRAEGTGMESLLIEKAEASKP